MLTVYNSSRLDSCNFENLDIMCDTNIANKIISGDFLTSDAIQHFALNNNTLYVSFKTYEEMSIQSDKGKYLKNFNQKQLSEARKESIDDMKDKTDRLFSISILYPEFIIENFTTAELEEARVETNLPHADAVIYLTAKKNGITCIWTNDIDFSGLNDGIIITDTYTYDRMKHFGVNAIFK